MREAFLGVMTLAASVAAAGMGPASSPPPSTVIQAMKEELSRSMAVLKAQPTPPYFLSYEITETDAAGVSGSFGTLVTSGQSRRRQLDTDLRVGDYSFDNTRPVRGGGPFFSRFQGVPVPIEDDPAAIRAVLWYDTDQRYKRAVEQLTAVKTNAQVKVETEDKSGDFSKESPALAVEPSPPLSVERSPWEQKVRRYTAPFARYDHIYEATADFSANRETRYYVDSEGSSLQTSQVYYRLFVSAFTKADDGMELPRYESYFAHTPAGLPDDATVLRAVDKMIQDLENLRQAPVVDPYTGPAILSGRAAGVFFHEVFGHRIEGHRQKREEEGQTFRKMVDQRVLPEIFSVYFDPTVSRAGNTDLVGTYHYDNQGVKARRVPVIENGVFKSFLMSRTPIDGFPSSNGHGRRQAGLAPVARQSNLLVEVSKPMTSAGLKQALVDQLKQQGRPFGLLFDDITGGFTITARTIPNAFNVLPIMVYRIYPDGRQELVRGVDLIGTPLTTFSKIVAADDKLGVFNGVCGAESGGVPVAAVSPAVLVSQIEVQKKDKSQERPPLLPAPFAEPIGER
jgi:TldD protein